MCKGPHYHSNFDAFFCTDGSRYSISLQAIIPLKMKALCPPADITPRFLPKPGRAAMIVLWTTFAVLARQPVRTHSARSDCVFARGEKMCADSAHCAEPTLSWTTKSAFGFTAKFMRFNFFCRRKPGASVCRVHRCTFYFAATQRGLRRLHRGRLPHDLLCPAFCASIVRSLL